MNKILQLWPWTKYYCTFCFEGFLSISSWEYHDTMCHTQLELWLCDCHPFPAIEIFFRREIFINHLKDTYNIVDENEIMARTRTAHIGGNHSGSYWCGFCVKLINAGHLTGQHERIEHIAKHFKDGAEINKYVGLTADIDINGVNQWSLLALKLRYLFHVLWLLSLLPVIFLFSLHLWKIYEGIN